MGSTLLEIFKDMINSLLKQNKIVLIIIFLSILYLIKSVITYGTYVPDDRIELEILLKDESISLENIDIRKIDNLSRLFYLYPRKDYSGIEKWDVSHVKDMTDMFCSVDSENIPSWYMAEKWEEYETLITIESKAED